MKEQEKTLVLFDFDGTITNKDSFLAFIKFTHGKARFYAGFFLLFPFLLLYKIGVITNQKAKELVLSLFYKNKPISYLEERGNLFASQVLPACIRPKALEKIKEYQEKGYTIVVVSASIKEWLSAWCKTHNLQLISTELATKEGKITGKLSTPNCFGAEKVTRIRSEISLTNFSHIIAFGDSSGDKEMLALAQEAHFKPFRN